MISKTIYIFSQFKIIIKLNSMKDMLGCTYCSSLQIGRCSQWTSGRVRERKGAYQKTEKERRK